MRVSFACFDCRISRDKHSSKTDLIGLKNDTDLERLAFWIGCSFLLEIIFFSNFSCRFSALLCIRLF